MEIHLWYLENDIPREIFQAKLYELPAKQLPPGYGGFPGHMPHSPWSKFFLRSWTVTVNPRTSTFEDQAMGFDFLAPYFFTMFRAMWLGFFSGGS